MDDFLEILIPVVFIGIFIIRAIKAAMDQASEASRDEDDERRSSEEWRTAWEPGQQQEVSPPQPSQGPQWQPKPATPYASSSSTPPKLEVSKIKVQPKSPPPDAPARGYRSWADVVGAEENLGKTEQLSAAQVGKTMSTGMAPGFAGTADVVPSGPGKTNRQQVKLDIRGRQDLRRAVIFREIIDRPRAFDL